MPTFTVTPTAPGATNLHVHVRGQSTGNDYSDALPMTFLSSALVEIHPDSNEMTPLLNRVKYASFPGSQLQWQITLDADGGTALAADPSLVKVSLQTDAYGVATNPIQNDPSRIVLVAKHPGVSALHVAIGNTTRDLELTVVDPSEAVSVEFHSLPAPDGKMLEETLEGPDPFSATTVTSLSASSLLNTWVDETTRWAIVVKTRSGVRAMGGATALSITPGVASIVQVPDTGVLAVRPSSQTAAAGTLVGAIGNVPVSVPFTLTR
jgi:hypothetical protein